MRPFSVDSITVSASTRTTGKQLPSCQRKLTTLEGRQRKKDNVQPSPDASIVDSVRTAQSVHFSSQAKQTMSSGELQNTLLFQVGLMRARAASVVSSARHRYRPDFDRQIKQVLAFARKDCICSGKQALVSSLNADNNDGR